MSGQLPSPAPTGPAAPERPAAPPAAGATERPHPASPLIRGWFVLVAIALAFGRQAFEDSGRGDNGSLLSLGVRWILLIIVGAVALSAIAGFISWYFTKFVIDDHELRVETGAIFRNSRRLAFERIQSIDVVQPLSARMFGLVELRIEAGAGDRGIRLRYLKRDKADQFRQYLLARAHGEQASMAGSSARSRASALTDLSAEHRPIVTIGPRQLILGFLLSSEWLISLLSVVVAFAVTTFFGVTLYALPGLIPLVFGGINLVGRRLLAQFNYTMAESSRGLRVTRGLTNLTSQSLPLDRIQGLRICQSLLWKSFGWYRLDVDILGYGSSSERQESRSEASTILLPVATRQQIGTALARILPDFDLSQITLHPSPWRTRILRPIDGWTFRYGWDERVVVSRSGILLNYTNIVPHAKVQSVRIEQGLLQQFFRLASVHVDTPRGPVHLEARHLEPAAARQLALTELDRARAARRHAGLVPGRPQRPGPDDHLVLERFGLLGADPIGEGQESRVYALDEGHVLRIYRADHEAAELMINQLKPAYDYWAGVQTSLELPRILDQGELGGRIYSVDRRMSGMSFSAWLAQARPDERRPALRSYLDSAFLIQQLPVPDSGWARLFGSDPRIFPTFPALIHDQLARALRRIDHTAFPEAESWARQVVDDLGERECAPRLVHADYFPGNTYASTQQGMTVVRGVGDFSPHSLVADPIMDVAGASILMELEGYGTAAQDARWLSDLARERVGPDEARWFDVYRRYYSVYFGGDPSVVTWSRKQFAALESST